MKTKILFCYFLFIVLFQGMYAQKPGWIDFAQRNTLFPKETYLVGFSASTYDKNRNEDDQFKSIIEYAKTEIIENISVSITSVNQLNTYNEDKSFTQEFSQQSTAFSSAELSGLKTETWRDKKELFALAYVKRSDLINFYDSKLNGTLSNIETGILQASKLENSGNKEGALEQYYRSQQQLSEARQTSTILLGVQKHYDFKTLAELDAKIQMGIETITKSIPANPDEAALVIAEVIRKQLKNNNKNIKVGVFNYQDSKMASPFSAYFLKVLENKLSTRGINVQTPTSEDSSLTLAGTFWNVKDTLRIFTNLYDIANKVLASSETSIPVKWLTNNDMPYMPENFEEASLRQKIFTKDEIVNGGLHIDLCTNKGTNNLLFFEGETMKLTVRANHECYLRFIYYMADGSKVLLMDDYYISPEMVNKPVEVPETFVCAAPFGVENLQLNAQTTPFGKLNTTTTDGYIFIQDNTPSIQMKTRGFKRQDNSELKAEKRLTITTLRK